MVKFHIFMLLWTWHYLFKVLSGIKIYDIKLNIVFNYYLYCNSFLHHRLQPYIIWCGFEPTNSWSWAICLNHLTTATRLLLTSLRNEHVWKRSQFFNQKYVNERFVDLNNYCCVETSIVDILIHFETSPFRKSNSSCNLLIVWIKDMQVSQVCHILLQSLLYTLKLIISSALGLTETQGSCWFIILYFQQLLLLVKIDQTDG